MRVGAEHHLELADGLEVGLLDEWDRLTELERVRVTRELRERCADAYAALAWTASIERKEVS